MLPGVFFKAPVGITAFSNISRGTTRIPPLYTKLKLFHMRAPLDPSKPPEGSLCCITHILHKANG